MAITTAVCNSFKVEILIAEHDLTASTGHTFRAALYTSSATLNKSTTVYSATNEVSGTGYTATGNTLTNITPILSSDTAVVDFSDTTWTTASFTARGCELYNDTHASNAAMSVHDFGADKTVTSGTFTLQFPAAAAGTAIVEIA